jgi:DNA ligase-1
MTSLYKLTSSSLRCWSITTEGNKVIIEHGEFGGKKQVDVLNLNCANDALLEADRRIALKRTKQGYTTTIPKTVPDLPMLVSEYAPSKLPHEVVIQPKLDGIRCVATRDTMMTRRDEPIHSLPHIKQALQDLPPGIKLDGELYSHGKSFQDHMSIIRRKSLHANFGDICFYVFDVQIPDLSYDRRHLKLCDLVAALRTPFIQAIPVVYTTLSAVESLGKELFEEYEGVIIRDPDAYYENNGRPSTVQKLKWICSEECQILDIEAPLTGRSEGAAIFVCELNGVRFKVVPKMSIPLRKSYYDMKDSIIGSWTRVYYEKLSAIGTPLKPRAEGCFRKAEDAQ